MRSVTGLDYTILSKVDTMARVATFPKHPLKGNLPVVDPSGVTLARTEGGFDRKFDFALA